MRDLDTRLKLAYLMAAERRRSEASGVHSIHIELGSAALEHLKSLCVTPDEGYSLPSGVLGMLGGFPILETPEQHPDHVAIRMTELIF